MSSALRDVNLGEAHKSVEDVHVASYEAARTQWEQSGNG